ncbi:unnamed protein product [Polarella glacialis]|uniref:J domain-containing protein n=1 Tax=Polarella glacialis TaxID=89957 RepID=A0A813JRD8_POLGL|nr:unnamed protein product [Polarella glacialis]CAE8683235.1 unnamed protein product [Polarella glacialis]
MAGSGIAAPRPVMSTASQMQHFAVNSPLSSQTASLQKGAGYSPSTAVPQVAPRPLPVSRISQAQSGPVTAQAQSGVSLLSSSTFLAAKLQASSGTATRSSFLPGEQVEVRWGDSDNWFPARISQDNGDGTCTVDWPDGNARGRTKRLEAIRRSSASSPSSSSSPAYASPSPGVSGYPSSTGFAQPQSPWTTPGAAGAQHSQSPVGSAFFPSPAQPQGGGHEPAAAFAAASADASPSQIGGSTPQSSDATAQDEDALPESEAPPEERGERDDVKVYMQELANGERCVMVQRIDGKKWRFNRSAVEFELQCTAETLKDWLGGLVCEQLPGLLTLLADEVNIRGGKLKETEKDRDSLRGTEDYDFFGLNGDQCSDKDIERAYRKKSTQLHPDKGGDEASFNNMREKYDQLKSLRNESKRKEGGGSIRWDARSRDSMLKAHGDLREQLVWITRNLGQVQDEVVDLRRRNAVRHSLEWEGMESLDAQPPAAC